LLIKTNISAAPISVDMQSCNSIQPLTNNYSRMIKDHYKTILCLFISLNSITGFTQQTLPYKNPSLPVEERVNDLLSRMSMEEKFWQLFMIPGDLAGEKDKYNHGIFGLQISAKGSEDAAGQILDYSQAGGALHTAHKINEIQRYFVEESRLGIPIIPFEEALHGLIGADATAFPQAIGLAASWDINLMSEVATAIAHEARSRGIRMALSPVVNIASDVRWGRVEETYGEDPFLTSMMGVAFVSAFENMGIITSPKHFLANVGDGGRDSYPIDLSDRYLEEYHLPPFKACISKGGARSIMTSYNSLDGSPCTAHDRLLNQMLKKDLEFKGFVISDACAVGGANVLHYTASDYPDASAKSINNGLDVIFQTDYEHHKLFMPPFLDGKISESIIDEAVKRVLRIKFELGLFENPYVDESEIKLWNNIAENKALAREAAQKSMVLLKNRNNTLPLAKYPKKIALIGTDATEGRLGGYSGQGNGIVTILEGLQNKVGPNSQILFAPGCGRNKAEYVTIPDSCFHTYINGKKTNGVQAEFFNNIHLEGKPQITRTDRAIDYRWTLYGPDPSINFDFFSARWTGSITAPATGTFKIGIEGNDGFRLYINNQLLIDNWTKQSYSTKLADFHFEKGKEYDFRLEFFEASGSTWFKMIWDIGIEDNSTNLINEAVSIASGSDVAIIVAGIEEGEGRDRAILALPGLQQEMIKQIASTGKPVIVVLIGGSAITMSEWINDVNAVLMSWYPGEEGGNALADVIFGDYNPAGRLPITFPVTEGQLPLVYNHKPTGRNDDYGNFTGKALFPFGFGLSYTSFSYKDIKIQNKTFSNTDTCFVSFKLKNTGKMAGEETVQLYINDILASVIRPVKELKGFQKVYLEAGEEKEIFFSICPDMLKMLDSKMNWTTEPGDFRLMIGASSSDIRLREIISFKE